ncbi:MAG: hypothetical protein AAFR90_01925 [Pseudomonadota bacterium]
MARFEFGYRDLQDGAASAPGADALFQLGLMYSAGRDVEVNLIEAHKWFNLAALRGNDIARQYRMEVARDMSKSDISKAQRLARQWLAVK